MELDMNSDKPLFVTISRWLEDLIITGVHGEEEQIPSTTDVSVTFKINPATVLKGVNMLVDAGLIYKKRGMGMFVAEGARKKLLLKRRDEFLEEFVVPLMREAKRLGIEVDELKEMIGNVILEM